MSQHYLKALFDPSSIALIGASETVSTQAAIITAKLHQQFTGKLYFVNPRHKKILESPCQKKVTDISEPIDLAIIVSPMRTVEKVIKQCADQGIDHVIVMTKFPTHYRGEVTSAMKSLRETARKLNVRLLGPSVRVVVRPSLNLNASVTQNPILPGKLALISRSSAMCNSVIDWAENEKVGFSAIISHGGGLDVDLADILDFLANDYRTNSIIVYINHIQNARRFMSALRAAAKLKPVIILKSAHENGGYSDVYTKIANVHVMHEIFLAAILRAGADHVSSLSNLFAAAKSLGSSQRTKGDKLGIISNGYGPVMLANDRLLDLGCKTTHFSESLVADLKSSSRDLLLYKNAVVVPDNEHTIKYYVENTKHLLADKELDAVAIFFAPSVLVDGEQLASEIAAVVKRSAKPVLAVWLGSDSGENGRKVLIKESISNYRTPEAAMDAFSFLCHHHANRQRLLQVPFPLKKTIPASVDQARMTIEASLRNKTNVLSTQDMRTVLDCFHIKNQLVDEVPLTEDTNPYLKVCILNDPAFGPVISLGFDGVLSFAPTHSVVQLPPLNRRLSEELINSSHVNAMLNKQEVVTAKQNKEKLRDLLMRVSEMATHLPEVFELTLNRIVLAEHAAVVGQAHVVVQKAKLGKKLFSHLAIHPYPSDWHRHITIKDDQKVEVRPIRAEDARAEIKFIDNMSKESRYFRFMYVVNSLTPEMLSNFTQMDYDREMAFGAFMQKDGEEVLLGESRYAINPDRKSCEFSIVVDDNYQGMGMARQLMLILIEHIKDHDLEIIEGTVLKHNAAMDKLMMSLGFSKRSSEEDYDINIYTLKYA
ncbi:GNAT family N-acetyltransferase [Leucothrix sargassi]|nr:GNAT family N-acetyltransferase [Leucothrix sargassi]